MLKRIVIPLYSSFFLSFFYIIIIICTLSFPPIYLQGLFSCFLYVYIASVDFLSSVLEFPFETFKTGSGLGSCLSGMLGRWRRGSCTAPPLWVVQSVCLSVFFSLLTFLLFFSHLAMLWRWSTQYKQHLSGRIITSIIIPQRVNGGKQICASFFNLATVWSTFSIKALVTNYNNNTK